MDGRAPGVWCVLALLVVSAAVSRAEITSITLESMTWTADSLTVCATNLSTDATSYRLDVNGGQQTAIDGESDDGNPICALFNITGLSSVPLATETKYELTAFYNASVELQSGAVTFAFPLSQGTTVSCGNTSQFGRFVVDSGASVPDASCFSDSASGVCYINTDDSGTLCVPGLDENTEGFEVCVPSGSTDGITDGLISAVSLSYDEDRIGGSFKISSDTETNPIELLSVAPDSTGDPSVTICDGNACTFASGDPSIKVYDLCSVYVDSDGNVASVGNYSFQDLQLTVDVVGTTTVDFRFANKNAADDYVYNVYGDDIVSNPTTDDPSFTLDCSHISPDSFCNGFFDDQPLPTHISVSSLSKNNVVVSPVTTTTTTTTTTTSTTSSTTASPKVEENAMDLTDQKTEGIVPSSA